MSAPAVESTRRQSLAMRRRRRKQGRFGQRWTKEEDAILVREWGEVGVKTLRALLKGRTWGAIRARATRSLGLPLGVAQGSVSLREAARVLGLGDGKAVVSLANRMGVAVRRYPAPRSDGPKRMHRMCVDLDAIKAALAREVTATESMHAASSARGVSTATMWRWLTAAGVVPPPAPGKRHRGRSYIPTETIDRVVAERRAKSRRVA